MTARTIFLDDSRNNLNLRSVVERLTREGNEEGAVRPTIAKIRVDGGQFVTMLSVYGYRSAFIGLSTMATAPARLDIVRLPTTLGARKPAVEQALQGPRW